MPYAPTSGATCIILSTHAHTHTAHTHKHTAHTFTKCSCMQTSAHTHTHRASDYETRVHLNQKKLQIYYVSEIGSDSEWLFSEGSGFTEDNTQSY